MCVSIAVFTQPSIPAGAEAKIAVFTRNKPHAEITTAIVTEDETIIKAYGHNGKEIEVPERDYELGGITKTFVGAICARAIGEGLISFNDRAGDCLPLGQGIYNASVIDLVTHTSAYGSYTAEKYSSAKLRAGKNPFAGIRNSDIILAMDNFRLLQSPPFMYSYSDFGTAILGLMASSAYGTDIYTLLSIYVQKELELQDTYIATEDSEKSPDNGWIWDRDEAFISAAGLTSNINDMIKYASMYLNSTRPEFTEAARILCEVNNDLSIGYFWELNHEGTILYQGGETSNYASYIAIDLENHIAVIVLSNYPNDKYGDMADITKALLSEYQPQDISTDEPAVESQIADTAES